MIVFDSLKHLLFYEAKEHFEKNPTEFTDCEVSAIEIVSQYVDLSEAVTLPDRLKLPVAMLISYFQYLRSNKSDEESRLKYEKAYDRAIALLADKVVPVSVLGEMEGLMS